MMINKYFSLKELRQAAGVCRKTFYNWLRREQPVLLKMGVKPGDRLLPSDAVEYLCEKFDISLPGVFPT